MQGFVYPKFEGSHSHDTLSIRPSGVRNRENLGWLYTPRLRKSDVTGVWDMRRAVGGCWRSRVKVCASGERPHVGVRSGEVMNPVAA